MKLTIYNISLDIIKGLSFEEKRKLKEDMHQIAFVDWFRYRYNDLIFSIPNEHILSKPRQQYTAKKLNRMGRTRGAPDLFIPSMSLFVEMKKIGGKRTKDQTTMHERLALCGYKVIVAYGAEDASDQIDAFIQARNARNPLA